MRSLVHLFKVHNWLKFCNRMVTTLKSVGMYQSKLLSNYYSSTTSLCFAFILVLLLFNLRIEKYYFCSHVSLWEFWIMILKIHWIKIHNFWICLSFYLEQMKINCFGFNLFRKGIKTISKNEAPFIYRMSMQITIVKQPLLHIISK